MFGCFTRNIYVSKICLHFCVLLNYPMTASGEAGFVLPFPRSNQKIFLKRDSVFPKKFL